MKKFLAGKKDVHLSRYHQYKQLEKKALSKKMSSSNEQFLHESNGYSYYGNYRGGVGSAGDEVGWKVGEEYG